MSFTILDKEKWARKEHFEFFSKFDEPFYGVVVTIDVTGAYRFAKENKKSFFVVYLHRILKALNSVENLRYRIREDEVVIHDKIGASATIARENETFGFSNIEFSEDFDAFNVLACAEIDRVKNNTGLEIGVSGDDVIHFSALPWVDFTSISHARSFAFPDSCPKISVGKLKNENGKLTMPMSVHVHHALADALHVGRFIEQLEKELRAV